MQIHLQDWLEDSSLLMARYIREQCMTFLKPWAQLFEGLLTLKLGLNLTRVSFSVVQKHHLR